MKNKDHIIYTYLHRKVVIFLANKYVKEDRKNVLEQIIYHDIDKLFMYLFYNKKDVSSFHRKMTSHHENDIEKTYIDYIEMVLDWESARYTKEDKPLNAYDTLYKYYPSMEKEILPILKLFSIDKPNLPMEKDVVEYVETIKDVKLEDIRNEMIDFIKNYFDKYQNTTKSKHL